MTTIRIVHTMTPEQWATHARERTGPFRNLRTETPRQPSLRAMTACATATLLQIPVGIVVRTYQEGNGDDAA